MLTRAAWSKCWRSFKAKGKAETEKMVLSCSVKNKNKNKNKNEVSSDHWALLLALRTTMPRLLVRPPLGPPGGSTTRLAPPRLLGTGRVTGTGIGPTRFHCDLPSTVTAQLLESLTDRDFNFCLSCQWAWAWMLLSLFLRVIMCALSGKRHDSEAHARWWRQTPHQSFRGLQKSGPTRLPQPWASSPRFPSQGLLFLEYKSSEDRACVH